MERKNVSRAARVVWKDHPNDGNTEYSVRDEVYKRRNWMPSRSCTYRVTNPVNSNPPEISTAREVKRSLERYKTFTVVKEAQQNKEMPAIHEDPAESVANRTYIISRKKNPAAPEIDGVNVIAAAPKVPSVTTQQSVVKREPAKNIKGWARLKREAEGFIMDSPKRSASPLRLKRVRFNKQLAFEEPCVPVEKECAATPKKGILKPQVETKEEIKIKPLATLKDETQTPNSWRGSRRIPLRLLMEAILSPKDIARRGRFTPGAAVDDSKETVYRPVSEEVREKSFYSTQCQTEQELGEDEVQHLKQQLSLNTNQFEEKKKTAIENHEKIEELEMELFMLRDRIDEHGFQELVLKSRVRGL